MSMAAWNWHMTKNGKGRTPHWFVVYNRKYNAYAVVNTFDGKMMYFQESPTPYGAYDPEEHVICWHIGRFESSTRLTKFYYLCDMMLELDISTMIKTGWFSPDGVLFSCSGEGHSWLADSLVARFYPSKWDGYRTESVLEDDGWVRLNYAHASFMSSPGKTLLSMQQIRAIEALEDNPDLHELTESLRYLAHRHKRQYERTDAALPNS